MPNHRAPAHEDFAVVLLEDSHATSPTGVVLYDPLQSSMLTTTKNVPLPAPPPTHDAARRHRREQRLTRRSTSGAIRPGGRVELVTRTNVGLLINFMIVGMFDGMAHALAYPLFKVYLHLEGHQQQAAAALVGFGWSCKFVFGYLSDCVPIQGQRRKPYAMVGLVILLIVSAGMAIMPTVRPYMKSQGIVYNEAAPRQSQRYVFMVMFASFGHVLLSVACEGLMVQYAHRESESERGRVQGTMYSVRFLGELLSTLVVALGCSSPEYGGEFSFSVSLNVLMGFMALAALCGLYATRFHMADERVVLGRQPMYIHVRSLWRFVERRATWQITLAGLLQAFAFLYKIPQQDTIYELWLQGDTLSKSLFFSLSCGAYAVAIHWLRSDALRNSSWKKLLVVTTSVSTVVGLFTSWLVAMDICRCKIFYLVQDQVIHFCDAFNWMIRLLIVVEIAEPAYEASSYALVTMIYNLAIPLSTATSNAVSAALSIDDEALQEDSRTVRSRVLSHYVIMYSLRLLLGLGSALLLFPSQKNAVRVLKLRGNPNALVPLVLLLFFLAIYFITWISVLLSMFQTTSCLRIAGGSGCNNQ